VRVEPRSNNSIAAGLSSFPGDELQRKKLVNKTGRADGLKHHQSLDLARHPQKAKPTQKKLRAKDRPLANDFVSDEEFDKLLRAWFGNIAELLDRFATRRDADAFAALLGRHGPMVLGVCRRLLSDAHDAEDAFQATFLVLIRRAHALGKPELLGNWLYGVAYRTALKAKADAARRRTRERRLTTSWISTSTLDGLMSR
jgi:hypothetical protein